jgi:hypothetical protein
VLVALGLVLAAAPAAAGFPGEVPRGKTLVIVGQEELPPMEDYVRRMGEPGGFMHYISIASDPAFLSQRLDSIGEFTEAHRGTVVQLGLDLTSVFWSTLYGRPSLPGALEVSRGTYDAQIEQLADWLNQIDVPVYLRIGYEFDLLGGQWGAPTDYRRAYRRIVDRLRAAGVDNVAYVWHSAGPYFRAFDYSGAAGLLGTLDPTEDGLDTAIGGSVAALSLLGALQGNEGDLVPIRRFYPGRDYVDYFGLSWWDDACCFGRSSAAARAIYRRRARELIIEAGRMGLPTMFSETIPAYIGMGAGEASLRWLRRYFHMIGRYDIRATALIVENMPAEVPTWRSPIWGGFWPDGRVHAYRDTRRLWRREIGKPRYLSASPRLGRRLGVR